MTIVALPHSGTLGSPRARRSPRHFAVRRALHRPLAPRHPPAALCSLFTQSVSLPQVGSEGFSRWAAVTSVTCSWLGSAYHYPEPAFPPPGGKAVAFRLYFILPSRTRLRAGDRVLSTFRPLCSFQSIRGGRAHAGTSLPGSFRDRPTPLP